MKILITGATGFIGYQLSQKLDKLGYSISILTKNINKSKALFADNIKKYYWDPDLNICPVEPVINSDLIINLAGENVFGLWSKNKKSKIRNSRIDSTKILVQIIKNNPTHRVRKFLSSSAIGYYGDREDEILYENSGAGKGFLAQTCLKWEQESLELDNHGVDTIQLRTGIVLGKNGGAFKKMLYIYKFGLGGRLSNGKQWWSWIHIKDFIDIIDFLIRNDFKGPLNIVSPYPYRQSEFSSVFSKTLKRTNLALVPSFALKILMGELALEILGSRRVNPQKLIDLNFAFNFPELDNALKDIIG